MLIFASLALIYVAMFVTPHMTKHIRYAFFGTIVALALINGSWVGYIIAFFCIFGYQKRVGRKIL
jgi:hypothetical protein